MVRHFFKWSVRRFSISEIFASAVNFRYNGGRTLATSPFVGSFMEAVEAVPDNGGLELSELDWGSSSNPEKNEKKLS